MKASVESVAAEREVAGLDIAPECKLYWTASGTGIRKVDEK